MTPIALAEGSPTLPREALPPSFSAGIAARIAAFPEATLSEYDATGGIRSSDYSALWERAGTIAAELQQRGIPTGRPIALLTGGVLDFVSAFWACLRGGFAAAPLTSVAHAASLARSPAPLEPVFDLLRPAAILADDRFHPLFEPLRETGIPVQRVADLGAVSRGPPEEIRRDWDELVCILHSSGTTGEKKLVALSEGTMLTRVFGQSSTYLGFSSTRALNWFALDSVTGLPCAFLKHPHYLYVPTPLATIAPLTILDAVESFRADYLPINSYLADRVTDAATRSERRWDLSALRCVSIGTEAVVPGVVRAFANLLARHGAPQRPILVGYGMTETGLLASGEISAFLNDVVSPPITPPVGRPEQGATIRIADDQDRVLAEGEPGHIQIKAPTKMFSGYFGRPDLTAASYTPDGWFRTGDLGQLLEGSLTLIGRAKDLAVIGGRNYPLNDIEGVLRSLPAMQGLELAATVVRRAEDPTDSLAVFFEPRHRAPLEVGGLIRRMQRALNRHPGVAVRHWVPLWPGQIPRTAGGKLQRAHLVKSFLRGELRILFADAGPHRLDNPTPTVIDGLRHPIAAIWQRVLHLENPPRIEDDFFESGGHSLASAELLAALEEDLGLCISANLFFTAPTLGTLVRLAQQVTTSPPDVTEEKAPWPLPQALYGKLQGYVGAWSGGRPGEGGLVSLLNPAATNIPLAWVFQSDFEFSRLAERLGPDQPLFGMRSGSQVMEYSEDNVQAMALAYAREISALRPDGPICVGGNCQGAIIALALAQQLLRRRHQVPLLVLMEWSFPLQAYPGEVLLLFGAESLPAYPYLRYWHPDLAWRRAFQCYRVEYIQGQHGQFFGDENIGSLAEVLKRHLSGTAATLPVLLPAEAYRAELRLPNPPSRLPADCPSWIEVEVCNTSPTTWPAFRSAGLMLVGRWLDPLGNVVRWRDGGTPLPALAPQERRNFSLRVKAPAGLTKARLMIDLAEEGNSWFHQRGNPAPEIGVEIQPAGILTSIGHRAWSAIGSIASLLSRSY